MKFLAVCASTIAVASATLASNSPSDFGACLFGTFAENNLVCFRVFEEDCVENFPAQTQQKSEFIGGDCPFFKNEKYTAQLGCCFDTADSTDTCWTTTDVECLASMKDEDAWGQIGSFKYFVPGPEIKM